MMTVQHADPQLERPRRLFLGPSTMTILASYRCTAACKHCCFDSNPSLTQRVDLHDIIDFINQGMAYPELELVVFSGGECFLLGDDLVTAVRHCKERGLLTRCVTNGYWAKSIEAGRRRLGELVDAGLDQLNVSTGDYHQEYVDEDTVINAASLGVECGLGGTVIVIEMQKERRVSRDSLERNTRFQALVRSASPDKFKVLESPWIPMNLSESIPQPEGYMLNRGNLHLKSGCTSLYTTIVLTPKKNVGFCCGLTRERIPELNTIWEGGDLHPLLAEGGKDFMKIWLLVDGPERILAWAASKDPTIEWEDRYSHHCHVCLALFQDHRVRHVIRRHYRERVDDVLMRYCLMLRSQQAYAAAKGSLT